MIAKDVDGALILLQAHAGRGSASLNGARPAAIGAAVGVGFSTSASKEGKCQVVN